MVIANDTVVKFYVELTSGVLIFLFDKRQKLENIPPPSGEAAGY